MCICICRSSGWREVSESIVEVSRTHLRLHDGLVPALAERRSCCRVESLSGQLRHGLHAERETSRRTDDGRDSGTLLAVVVVVCWAE